MSDTGVDPEIADQLLGGREAVDVPDRGDHGRRGRDVKSRGIAREVAYARGSSGTEPVVQRGTDGAVYGEDGPALVRIDAHKLVSVFAFNERLGGQYFALTCFAFAHDGAIYADELPGNQGFESHQQLVTLTGHQITLLWQETNKSPGG